MWSTFHVCYIFFCCSLCLFFFFFFFFSSRRRHTRYIGDWSSDVCSSDLQAAPLLSPGTGITAPGAIQDHQWRNQSKWKRSEERRVGKECRYRGSADH